MATFVDGDDDFDLVREEETLSGTRDPILGLFLEALRLPSDCKRLMIALRLPLR